MDNIHFLQSRSGLHMLPKGHALFDIDATLNPYVGCSRRCLFCPYAFSRKVGYKTDFLHCLSSKLSHETKFLHLGLGTSCEVYGEGEDKLTIARHTIELVMRHQLPLQVFTKSDLVLRDKDLLGDHSRKGLAAVTISLSTLDRKLSRSFEPELPSPEDRLQLLRTLRKEGILAGVLLAPIIPYLTDSEEQLDEIFNEAKNSGAEYLLPAVLSIHTPELYQRMKQHISREHLRIAHRFEGLYEQNSLPSSTYTQRINDLLESLSRKHGLPLSVPRLEGPSGDVDIRRNIVEHKQ